MHNTPFLLVVGSGNQCYREYLLKSVAEHHRLWLLDANTPTWQASYVAGWTEVDVFDADRLVAAALQVAESNLVIGTLCYDEALILPAAHVVAALGLPGMSVEAV